jgi:Concanavalin A-like lectin/glucanases superfamily
VRRAAATPSRTSTSRTSGGGRATVAFDVFGANHGSYIGHPKLGTPGARPAATAVALNGLDQYVLLPRLITDDFSLELWFSSGGGRGTNVTQWWQAAGLLDGEVPGTVDDFGTSLDASGQVCAGTGNPDTSIHSHKGLADGKWHHVVLTRKASTGALTPFVDGMQVGAGRQRLTSAPGLRAGVLQISRNYLADSLADVAVYSSALPPATVTAHFRARQ